MPSPWPIVDANFEYLPTPDTNELAFRVRMGIDSLRLDALPQRGVTTYAEAQIPNKPRLPDQNLASYIFTLIDRAEPGYISFFFGAPKTEEEKYTPYKTLPGTMLYNWPRVVYAVAFAESDTDAVRRFQPGQMSNRQAIYVPAYRSRLKEKASVYAPSPMETRSYLSPTPFVPTSTIVPTPQPIWWEVAGDSGSATCLHEDMRLPAVGIKWGRLPGIQPPPEQCRPYRDFPATPMTDWQPFVLESEQSETDTGLYQMREVVLFPPLVGEEMTF